MFILANEFSLILLLNVKDAFNFINFSIELFLLHSLDNPKLCFKLIIKLFIYSLGQNPSIKLPSESWRVLKA